MNALLKASLWQPGQEALFRAPQNQAKAAPLEDIKILISIKGMLDECCQKEVRHLLTTIDVRTSCCFGQL